MAAILAAVWWSISWATGLQPLSVPSGSYAPRGLAELPHTADPADTGPPVYRWAGGGRYVVTLYLHNAASVPITITGADHSFPGWLGAFTGPTLGIPDAHDDGRYTAFHPIRIPADGIRGMTFVFHANPKACGNDDPRSVSSQDAGNVHFTASE